MRNIFEVPPRIEMQDFKFALDLKPSTFPWLDLTTNQSILDVKRQAVTNYPNEALYFMTETATPLFTEALTLFSHLNGVQADWSGLVALTLAWEPDFALMTDRIVGEGEPRMVAGSLCQPSSWNPADKIGKSIDEIHKPVPGLRENLGAGISRFLLHDRKDNKIFDRWGWGLAATDRLNMHPNHEYPRMTDHTPLEQLFLRREHQGFIQLEHGKLFMIRPLVSPLQSAFRDEQEVLAFKYQLTNMPDAIMVYKGITGKLRDRILAELNF